MNGWQKLLMKQDISIILAIQFVHLCTLVNEEQVGMPQTAHSKPHHHLSQFASRRVLTTQVTSGQVIAVSNAVLETDILSSLFED